LEKAEGGGGAKNKAVYLNGNILKDIVIHMQHN